MKQFILIREDGVLQLGVQCGTDAYDFTSGANPIKDILNGDLGNFLEVLSLEELQERIQGADDILDEGF